MSNEGDLKEAGGRGIPHRQAFLKALLLPRLGKNRWPVFIAIWLNLLYHGWMASPYLMMYVIGAPEVGTAPRYTGTLRADGPLKYRRGGSIPPRYFIKTEQGEKEFTCGFKPRPAECGPWTLNHFPTDEDVYTIGYSEYFGVDYYKFPERIKDPTSEKRMLEVEKEMRRVFLRHHTKSLWIFCGLVVLYSVLVAYNRRAPTSKSIEI